MASKIFADSDVVISSLISSSGAANLLLNQTEKIDLFVSTMSVQELERVTERLNLDKDTLESLIEKRFTIIQLEETIGQIQATFSEYVMDTNDAHIVAGAKAGNVDFIITYSTKHFNAGKLKGDFNIILTTPAHFLQYLRSK